MKVELKPVSEQVVVLVGASSGIGREAALRFAERGAKVVAAARTEEALQSLVEEIRAKGGEALAVVTDVTDFAQVQALAERAAAEYGRIDTWVHLAGVAMWASFEETTPEEFRRIIDVNLNGQMHGAKAALPYLKRQGGALIQVSSVEGLASVPLQTAYGASKHGLHGFLKALRMELRQAGANVSLTEVMPSSINTPLFTKSVSKIGVLPKPLPHIYQPGIVVDALLYAAEHPVDELIAGGTGKGAVLLQQYAPRLWEAIMGPLGVRLQRTEQPKPADAPNNLFRPLEQFNTVEGEFTDQARSTSVYTELSTHPAAKKALGIVLLGSAALLAARALRGRAGSG